MVWVGTNNHGHTAEQVAGGIKAIVQLVNQRQPQARVVVLVREWEGGENGWQCSGTPSCVAIVGMVLGSLAQSNGFQAKFHIDTCYIHQSSCE